MNQAELQTTLRARLAGETACWSRIGVYGDKSCVELTSFVHCRNCPVYSAAGLRLLESPLPEQYRQERTAQFAMPKAYREAGHSSVVLFRIAGEWLALPTWLLHELSEQRPIQYMPHSRNGAVLATALFFVVLVILAAALRRLQRRGQI